MKNSQQECNKIPKNMMDEILENQKVTNKKISHIMNRDFVVAKRDREKLDQQLNDLKKNVAFLTARLEERDKVQRGSSHASISASSSVAPSGRTRIRVDSRGSAAGEVEEVAVVEMPG